MGLSAATKRTIKTAQETVQTRAQAGQTQSQVFTVTEDGKTVRFRITPSNFGRFAKAKRID